MAVSVAAFCHTSNVELLAIVIGTVGWLTALMLRPAALFAMSRLGVAQSTRGFAMAAISGPSEELVRWPAILLAGTEVSSAMWLGIGWAFAEALSGAASVVVVRSTIRSGGERADAIRAQMSTASEANASRFMAGVERLSATLAHVGLSLWIAFSPALVVPAMIVHSGANIAALTVLQSTQSVAATELTIFATGAAVLAIGLLLPA